MYDAEIKAKNNIDSRFTRYSAYRYKKILYIGFFDNNDTQLIDSANASKQKIIIKQEFINKILVEGYSEAKHYGEIAKPEIILNALSTEDYSLYMKFEFSEESSDRDISNIILKNIRNRIDTVEFILEGNNTFEIYSDLIYELFGSFSNVILNLNQYCVVNFPKYDENKVILKSLHLKNGRYRITDRLAINAVEKITIENSEIIFYNSTNLDLFSKEIEVNGIIVNNVGHLKFAPDVNLSKQAFSEAKITLNNITYNLLKDIEKSNDTIYGTFKNPLIEIESFINVDCYNCILDGANYYKFIKVSGATNLSLHKIYRTGEEVRGYTIGLSRVKRANINDLNVISKIISNSVDIYSIVLDPTNYSAMDTVSISNFNIENVGIISLSGINAKEVKLIKGSFYGDKNPILSKNTSVGSIKFNECRFECRNEMEFEGMSISFNKTKLLFINDDKDITINCMDDIKFFNSYIVCGKGNLNLEMNYNCALTISESNISCNDFIAHKTIEPSEMMSTITNEANRKINISKSMLKVNNKFSVYDGIYSLFIDDSTIENSTEFNISDLAKFKSNNMNFNCNYKSLPIFVKNVPSCVMNIGLVSPPDLNKIVFENVTGDVSYNFKDRYDENDEKTLTTKKINCEFIDSLIGMVVSSEYNDETTSKINFKSSNSFGSYVLGSNSNITVVPDMASKDKMFFNKIYDTIKDKDTVGYGSYSESENEE